MAISLAIVIIFGLLSKLLFNKLKLPGLLGMIIVGVLIGPFGLDLLSAEIMMISADLRNIALIVILLRAGLGIKKEEIKQVGRPAIKMSFVPALLEGFTILFLSTLLFDLSFVQGGILGFIIAAVSPAVIVPAMLDLIDKGLGTKKNIPTLILAGASIDDIFAITVFSAFLGIYSGEQINLGVKILSIPFSIFLGIAVGLIIGMALIKIFKKYKIRDTVKILVILSTAVLLTSFQTIINLKIEIAAFLGVMAIGFILADKTPEKGERMAAKLNKIWVLAEILLFVLIGAQLNLVLALESGLKGLLLIVLGLIARSMGVLLSLIGTELNKKEKLFCLIAYLPKATVQAAIGAIPLTMGVESGDLILSLAVLAIIITAPIGSILIKVGGKRLLEREELTIP